MGIFLIHNMPICIMHLSFHLHAVYQVDGEEHKYCLCVVLVKSFKKAVGVNFQFCLCLVFILPK
jgi:hypothetical protein